MLPSQSVEPKMPSDTTTEQLSAPTQACKIRGEDQKASIQLLAKLQRNYSNEKQLMQNAGRRRQNRLCRRFLPSRGWGRHPWILDKPLS